MIVSLGDKIRPEDQQGIFVVTANIYSEEANDYVKHWDGGTFNNYQKAFDFWDEWEPPKDEIDQFMLETREKGDHSHYELEIKVWCEDLIGLWREGLDYDLPFMTMTLDFEHERN